MQRVLPHTGTAFEPLENTITDQFLPAILQEQGAIPGILRDRLALPVRQAGIGIPDPSTTGESCYAASRQCTEALTQSLRDGKDLDMDAHRKGTTRGRLNASASRATAAEAALRNMLAGRPSAEVRQARRATQTGAWLTATPDHLNGTDLSRDEFCDSLRLRYGLAPTALPTTCDGCAHRFSPKPSRPQRSPTNHLSTQVGTYRGVPADGEGTEAKPESRGDVTAHGFWKCGTTMIFDVRITDTDAPTNRQWDPAKVLKRQEKEKKDKYLADCLARRLHFTPLVFSVDGWRRGEADAAAKWLASLLWKRSFSEVCGFVRSRLLIALVRSTSMCLRGARDPTARASYPVWDTGAGLGLYRGL